MEVLKYLDDRYKEEQERFNLIEQKSYRMMSFLTFIFGGLAISAKAAHDLILNSDPTLKYALLILFGLALFCIICAWGHSLLSLKIDNIPHLPKSRIATDYIDKVEEEERIIYIKECYVDTIDKLDIAINSKAKYLSFAYDELTYSATFILIITLILFAKVV
jgi:hypothetical protein